MPHEERANEGSSTYEHGPHLPYKRRKHHRTGVNPGSGGLTDRRAPAMVAGTPGTLWRV